MTLGYWASSVSGNGQWHQLMVVTEVFQFLRVKEERRGRATVLGKMRKGLCILFKEKDNFDAILVVGLILTHN